MWSKSRRNSSASQFSKAYIMIFSVIMFVLTLAILLMIGLTMMRGRQDDGAEVLKSLESSFVDDKPDWNAWRKTSTIDTNNAFVKVTTKDRGIYYSKGAEELLSHKKYDLPFYGGMQYFPDHHLYYYISDSKNGVHYQIWLSLHQITHLFKEIVLLVLIIMVIGLLLGIGWMTVLAKRLNRPLVELTEASKQINEKENVTYHETLPVFDSPTEVHDMSIEFNKVLDSLNSQVIRERQFVSDASHELRTPIAGIRGHVKLIERRGDSHPEIIPTSLQFIDEESLRMQQMIESLLKLSRMNHAELDLAEHDVTEIVAKIVADYQPTIAQKIIFEQTDKIEAIFDEASLKQIVIALLDNAVKYSPKDSEIKLAVQKQAHRIRLSISDQGSGIPDDQKGNVFERFYRVDQARSQEIPGSGLGLAIVKELVDLNHGKIEITDNAPQGTIFNIYLKQ
jgi:signal transduction histidine kinase